MDHSTRTIVLAILLAFLVLGAGCAGFPSTEETTRDLKLVNQDETDHAVVVEIVSNGNLVYSDGRTVDGESQQDLATFDGTGDFEVTVSVDGNVTTVQHSFTPASGPVITNVGIDNDGSVTVG